MISNEALIVLGLIVLVLLVGVGIFLWWAGNAIGEWWEAGANAPLNAAADTDPTATAFPTVASVFAQSWAQFESIPAQVQAWWNSPGLLSQFEGWLMGTPPAATQVPTNPAQLAGTAPSGEVDPGSAGPAGSIAGFNYLPTTSPTGTGGDS